MAKRKVEANTEPIPPTELFVSLDEVEAAEQRERDWDGESFEVLAVRDASVFACGKRVAVYRIDRVGAVDEKVERFVR